MLQCTHVKHHIHLCKVSRPTKLVKPIIADCGPTSHTARCSRFCYWESQVWVKNCCLQTWQRPL